MRLGFQVDASGKIPLKVVARTFASGKTEKLIYQAFAELGLSSEKVQTCFFVFFFLFLRLPNPISSYSCVTKGDAIEKADFTFDKFLSLYHTICPSNDIEELFQSM